MQSKFNDTVAILEKLTGILPDENKTLEEYRQERLSERYEINSNVLLPEEYILLQ